MSLYLGPLGGLVKIRPPRQGVETPVRRYGGAHTAITGATTVDVTGHRARYAMKWRWLSQAEMEWFEAIHLRHIPGPLRLLLGYKRNRLSRSAGSLGYGVRDMAGVTLTAGSASRSPLWPADAPPAGAGLSWASWAVGDSVRLDRTYPVPVLPGETITASVYVRASAANAVRLDLDHYGATGYAGTTTGTAVNLTANTWQRLTLTVTPAADVWAVSPAVTVTGQVTANDALVIAAAQVEASATVSAWSLGGGAPAVSVDQMPTEAPRSGYTHTELTLVEA
ncbi:hypothetical protein [Saccharopolyspora sp. NPDC002376]